MTRHDGRMDRRGFLLSATSAGVALASSGFAADPASSLLAGEGTADITPPLGIEMGGFHRAPGNERRIKAIRQPPAARALVLEMDGAQVAVCSLDVPTVGQDMAARIQAEVGRTTGIPAENVRICTTHTHSMPAFNFLRQWGALPKDFMAVVERKTVEAVAKAKADSPLRSPSRQGARPGRQSQPDHEEFQDRRTVRRGLDRRRAAGSIQCSVLLFRRPGQRTLCWYHFSAHAVCFADESAGPDWPGMVAELVSKNEKLQPSFLQGHCGDVNPGDGRDWRGEANQTTAAIYPLKKAIAEAALVKVDCLKTVRKEFRVPLDMALFKSWRDRYQADPKVRRRRVGRRRVRRGLVPRQRRAASATPICPSP